MLSVYEVGQLVRKFTTGTAIKWFASAEFLHFCFVGFPLLCQMYYTELYVMVIW